MTIKRTVTVKSKDEHGKVGVQSFSNGYGIQMAGYSDFKNTVETLGDKNLKSNNFNLDPVTKKKVIDKHSKWEIPMTFHVKKGLSVVVSGNAKVLNDLENE